MEDLLELDMAELRGKKISTRQTKSIKGTHMIYNEATRLHECELCDYKREWRGNLQFHVLPAHYEVFLYRCPDTECGSLLGNWSAFQVHQKTHRRVARAGAKEVKDEGGEEQQCEESGTGGVEWHLLQEPVYLGEERGMAVARRYHRLDRQAGRHPPLHAV